MRMKHTERPILDERIGKATNAIVAAWQPWMLAMQGVLLLVKLLPGSALGDWWLDALALTAGLLTVLLWRTARGLWGEKDEVLRELIRDGDALAVGLHALMLILGAAGAMIAQGRLSGGAALSCVPLLPLGAWLLFTGVRRGLHVPATQPPRDMPRAERLLRALMRNLLTATVITATLWLFTRSEEDALRRAVACGLAWFVIDPLAEALLYRISQRRADKALADAEGADGDEESDA